MDYTWNYWNKSVVSGGGGNDIYNREWREREKKVLYHGRKRESCCVIERKIERGRVVWERGRRKGEI
jgi:hypothetical protein